MSLRVLVIPEDPTYNGYILKPLVERLLADCGKPRAKVVLLVNPRLNGFDDAKCAIREELANRYGHFGLWLFLPDADRAKGLEGLEKEMGGREIRLLCCAAQPEVEAWLIAGHKTKIGIGWSAVRSHPRLKEEVFEPFLTRHGDRRGAGEGRERLLDETLKNLTGLLELCPELRDLKRRILATLRAN